MVHFRENVPGGRRYVLPMELLMPGDQYTLGIHRLVKAACREAGTDWVIVRTSERSDWDGMVDTMPTKVIPANLFSLRRVRAAIQAVRMQCHHPDLLRYAEVEGNGYDPEKVTVSVTPWVSYPHGSVTEHPNIPGRQFVDVCKPSNSGMGAKGLIHRCAGYQDGEYIERSGYVVNTSYGKKGLAVANWARESGDLPEDRAYQFEEVGMGGYPKLTQVRDFAVVRLADFRVERKESSMTRNFGVTPPEGVVIRCVRYGVRGDIGKFINGLHDDADPFMYFATNVGEPLTLVDHVHPLMQGYVVNQKSPLSHNNMRFVQAALRAENGVAFLGRNRNTDYQGVVRVVSDGERRIVERAA